jgi:hypothetical protein
MRDGVTVIPDRAAVKEVARALLALARDPQDVRTAGNGNEFTIPPYLADLYNAPSEPKPRRRIKKEEGDQ